MDEAASFLEGGLATAGLGSEACLGVGSFSRESSTPWTYLKSSFCMLYRELKHWRWITYQPV